MKPPQHNTPPPALTTVTDVIRWRDSLIQWHARLASHFARPEPYQRMLRFVHGILSHVERKNGWQLAEHAREATPYGMQRLLSQAVLFCCDRIHNCTLQLHFGQSEGRYGHAHG